MSYPFSKECERSGAMINEDVMKGFMQQHQRLSHDPKYEILRATHWWVIEDVYDLWVKFDSNLRPTAMQVLRTVSSEESLVTRKLRVSQSSAVQQADLNFALNFNDIIKNSAEHQIPPQNDGTNACTFLASNQYRRCVHAKSRQREWYHVGISRTSGGKGHNQPSTKNK